MVDILRRLQDEEQLQQDSDEDADDDMEARFADLELEDGDLPAEELWARLTAAEQRDFEAQIRAGTLSDGIAEWTPWWMAEAPRIADGQSASLAGPDVPALQTLLGTRSPAPELPNNLVDVLAAFAFAMRLHNGESLAEAAETAVSASVVLGGAVVHASPAMAAAAVLQRIQHRAELASAWPIAIACIGDAARILASTAHVARALRELHELITAAASEPALPKPAVAQLRAAQRKALFFRSWWAWYQGQADCALAGPLVCAALEAEHVRRQTEAAEMAAARSATELRQRATKPPRPLIQEL